MSLVKSVWDFFDLSSDTNGAQSAVMKALAKKSARPHTRRTHHTATSTRPGKPTKQEIKAFWKRTTGIVSTGETDLSTREGFGD